MPWLVGHRLPALGDGPGAPRDAEGLEHGAGDPHLQPVPLRHLPDPLGDHLLGPRLRRVDARAVLPGLHRRRPGRLGRAAGLAPAAAALRSTRSRATCRARRSSSSTTCCWSASPSRSSGARCSRSSPRPPAGEKITVGQGYYNQVALPIGIALLVLTGVGPLIAWRKASPGPAAAALRRRRCAVAAVAGRPAAGPHRPLRELARGGRSSSPGVFVIACIAGEFWRGTAGAPRPRRGLLAGRLRQHGRPQPAPLRRLRRPPGDRGALHRPGRARKGFATEVDIAVARGRAAPRWPATRSSTRARRAPPGRPQVDRQRAASASSAAASGSRTMTPGRRHLRGRRAPRPRWWRSTPSPARDLYLVLTELSADGLARLSVFVNPLVLWLWVAGAIIAHRRPDRRLARPAVGRAASPRPPRRRGGRRGRSARERRWLAGRADPRRGGAGGRRGARLAAGRRAATSRAPPDARRRGAGAPSRRTSSARSAAIREIEMDHRAGNLSDEDFAALDARRAGPGGRADAPRATSSGRSDGGRRRGRLTMPPNPASQIAGCRGDRRPRRPDRGLDRPRGRP